MRRVAVVLAAVGLTGCVSLQPGAGTVRLSSNADLVKGCKFLGQETLSIEGFESSGVDNFRKDLITKLKNRAHEMGGTDVITNGPVVMPAQIITGDIYRCV